MNHSLATPTAMVGTNPSDSPALPPLDAPERCWVAYWLDHGAPIVCGGSRGNPKAPLRLDGRDDGSHTRDRHTTPDQIPWGLALSHGVAFDPDTPLVVVDIDAKGWFSSAEVSDADRARVLADSHPSLRAQAYERLDAIRQMVGPCYLETTGRGAHLVARRPEGWGLTGTSGKVVLNCPDGSGIELFVSSGWVRLYPSPGLAVVEHLPPADLSSEQAEALVDMLLAWGATTPTTADHRSDPIAVQPPDRTAGQRKRQQAIGLAALTGEAEKLTSAPLGGRNNALNRAAFTLGGHIAMGRVGEDDALEGLAAAARTIGLGATEIRQTIRSGLRAGASAPIADLADRPFSPDPAKGRGKTRAAALRVAPAPAVIDLSDHPEDSSDQAEADGNSEDTRPPVAAPAVLPPEFWAARPMLGRIRTAALGRLLSPDAVFGAVLARVASMTHHRLQITAASTLARDAPLSIIVGVVAPSGAGKGSALDLAAVLVPDPAPEVHTGGQAWGWREAPAGSGEGMVKLFFAQVREKDEDGKLRTRWERSCHNVLIRLDEGEALGRLASRRDQTTMQVLRSAWSGEALGSSYSDESKNLHVERLSYSLGMVCAVQPEHTDFLFGDAAGGTPQRFIFLRGRHPDVDAVDVDQAPQPVVSLGWRPIVVDQTTPTAVGVPDEVRRELRLTQKAKHRDDYVGDPLDAHGPLNRLKVAALLAVLEGRTDISPEDWALAGMVWDTSVRCRDEASAVVRWAADEKRRATIALAVRIREAEDRAEGDRFDRAAKQASQILLDRLERGPQRRADLSRAMPGRWKGNKAGPVFQTAIDLLVEQGRIEQHADGRWALVRASD